MIRLVIFLLFSLPATALAQSEVYFRQQVPDRNLIGLTAGEMTLVQTGQLNQLRIQETGKDNLVRLSQHGTNNTLDLELNGNGNRYTFAQQGDNNLAQWQAKQQNSQFELMQRGNNNQLIQEGGPPNTGVPMRIEQSGGMQLILKTGY